MSDKDIHLPPFDAMKHEHEAWIAWCQEFKTQVGYSLNEDRFNLLTKLIAQWGEELVALRVEQAPDIRLTALNEARLNATMSAHVQRV